MLLMMVCVVWTLVLPCLTDGHEGNRMRFAVSPYLIVLTMMLFRDLGQRRQMASKSTR